MKKTSIFQITDDDGYKVEITVLWHTEKPMSAAEIFPMCGDPGAKSATAQVAMMGVVAEVNATFPTTDGFSWPAEKRVRVGFSDGKSSQYWDRANTCSDIKNPGTADLGTLYFAPSKRSAKVMWVRTAEKTPNNPEGQIESTADGYVIDPTIDPKGSCEGAGVTRGAIMGCSTTYGD